MSAPNRRNDGTYYIQTTWKYPAAVTNQKSDGRATYVVIRTMLDGKVGNKSYRLQQDVRAGGLVTEMTRNLGAFVVGRTTWNRNHFYPLTSRTLTTYWTHVKLCNPKGSGPWQSTKRGFYAPRRPSITVIEQNRDTGTLTCTIDTDAGRDHLERYDTRYIVDVYDGTTGGTSTTDTSSRSTSFSVTRDIANRSALTYEQYIHMRVRACARGYAGDSAWVERNYYMSWPPLPVVSGVDVSTTDPSGKVTVRVVLKQSDPTMSAEQVSAYNTQHPVTGCRLEILRNSEADTPQEAAASDQWTPMDYQDNGNCTALSATVTDLASSRGLHTWVRVKSWNDIEEIFYRYSMPMEVGQLYLAPPSESESGIAILDARSGGDGRSVVLSLGWNASGADTMTGTETSWSENPNAWRSTAGPSTHEFTWSDGEVTSGGVTYHDSAVLHVDGLTEGTLYHFRVRRYQDRESGDRLYGDYFQNVMTSIPATSPSSVTLHAAGSVATGRPLEVTWSYDSESMQTAYEVITGTIETRTDSEGNETHWIADDGLGIVATGSDSRGSYVISADALQQLSTDGTVALAVRVSTGGTFVTSQAATVSIDTPPVAGLLVSDVTAQPASVALTSNVGTASANVSVVAQGADGSMPDGTIAQVGGDVVWSGNLTPEWAESDGTYGANLTLPSNLSLYDGARYTVTVTLTDNATGLQSAPVSGEFGVAWAHQAPAPPDEIAVTPSDVTDGDGIRTISAEISLVAPEGAAEGDLYDVYRVLDDEVQLIAEGRELGSVVTDPYAPFGNRTLSYRVACRTADGDVDWDDYEYELLPRDVTDGLMMRIDFGGRYVELDRGVSYSDRRTKEFVGRSHLGEATQRGYWGDGLSRGGQSAATAVMVYERDLIDAMDALAVHRGPCYVRLSNGMAYEADVQVSGTNLSVGSAGVQYSLAIAKVALTQDYAAAPVETSEGGE